MRRTLAIGVVVIAMIAAVGIAAGVLIESASNHVSGWVMTGDTPQGTKLTSSNVQQVSIPTGTDSFKVLTTSPVGLTLAHSLKDGDVLRSDDLITSSMVDVPVNFKVSPGLSANDAVDIYASTTSGTTSVAGVQGTELIAKGVTVVSVGQPSVISVPASQEPLWVSLSSADVTLIASLSGGANVPTTSHTYTPDQALTILSQLAGSQGSGQ